MHIVLSGYYGFDNVGDEAILFSIISAFRKLDPEVKITVLSNNPESTAATYGVNAVNRWKFAEVGAVLKEADGLVSGGGSLLQDKTGLKSIPYYTGIMRMAKKHGKPVFIYAQGMGPIDKWISKFITKGMLNKVDGITVRDEASRELLRGIGVKKDIKVVPDPVIGLSGSDFRSDWLASQSWADDSYVSVSVRDWPSSVPFMEKIADGLDRLAASGVKIVFVPMHGEHDAKASASVAEMMKEASVIAPADLSIEEKIAVIGESALLIGLRLHSLIFAAIQYTPFIALSYDPKIDAFADIVSQPVLGHVEKDDWSGQALYDRSTAVLSDRSAAEAAIRSKVEKLQIGALETAKLALEVFKK
ncbi:polysaccharide pyruvyl transferase CsaB [Ureibacillus acetophenoni]|uniref:Polysaccharide pyruvyl transferase CsaB n=1 Tax=Ureibacillus acetophenoni TaxID=614649 RepID=A0A285U046_9BACL|nr:polysaccharide pyruvyl transferase CsaB [Ureibacillus acetophenoni]SOC34768.1 polysaccharide pyruvyl transferase CsaB [Ureibacillus acetophenoni]